MSSATITGGHVPSPATTQRIIGEEGRVALRKVVSATHTAVLTRMEPHRRTGGSMRNVYSKVITAGGEQQGIVGTNYLPIIYNEFGTGLWGPLNHLIYPVQAKALRFPNPGMGHRFTLGGRLRSGAPQAGSYIFARYVRGVRPQRWFQETAMTMRGPAEAIFVQASIRAANRIVEAARLGF